MSSNDKKPLTTIRQLQSRLSSAKERGLILSFHSPRSSVNPHPGKWVLDGEPYEDLNKYLTALVPRNVINGTEMSQLLHAPAEPASETTSKPRPKPKTKLQELTLNAQLKALLRRVKGAQLMELDVECVGMLTKLVTELKEYVA